MSRQIKFFKASLALNELGNIQKEFKNFTPKQIIWGIENVSFMPPWGDNISNNF
ncbi:Imm70 family immunity protein [Helicobacter equorum]|uniref:Imm70 family immunity protein n=1 Tax=Helicobacter equorum TaxID=361872 RepID=UPI002D798B17|nr:Imm70 family immunity protein [Helicobacter equorum]